MMKIGRLRHRITLQKPVAQSDTFGQKPASWTDVATVWASVDPLSATRMSGAKELEEGGVETARDAVRVVLRPRTVGTDWRFVHDGKTYDIKAVRPNNAGDELTLYAQVNQ